MGSATAAILAIALVLTVACPPAAATATHEQGIWFVWTKSNLDVLIADSIQEPLIAHWIEEAISLWGVGISHWNATLGNAITFRVHWAGSGAAPPLDFRPDIVFVPQGSMAVHAGGAGPELQPTCYVTAPMLVARGSFIRVAAHEFGHCLGLGHVSTGGVEGKPSQDIMGDGAGIGQGDLCVSTLNVKALESIFGLQSGATVSIPAASYMAC